MAIVVVMVVVIVDVVVVFSSFFVVFSSFFLQQLLSLSTLALYVVPLVKYLDSGIKVKAR